jgi:hypothetical protein
VEQGVGGGGGGKEEAVNVARPLWTVYIPGFLFPLLSSSFRIEFAPTVRIVFLSPLSLSSFLVDTPSSSGALAGGAALLIPLQSLFNRRSHR